MLCDAPDLERLKAELQSPDEAIRARPVRALCPCHAGWMPFEQHLKMVAELQKDPSPIVRAAALHVFEDAAEIESSGYPTNPARGLQRDAAHKALFALSERAGGCRRG